MSYTFDLLPGLLDKVGATGPPGPPGPPATCVSAPQLLCLGGRTGSNNNPLLSLDADGQITGSEDASKRLLLASSPSVSPAQIAIGINASGLDRLLIGQGSDPTEALAPGGLLQFVVTADQNLVPVPALFGAWSLNGGIDNGATFFGIGGNGSFASPTASRDGDNLFKVAGLGFDSTDAFVGNPPAASVLALVDGTPTPGGVLGQLLFGTADSGGSQSPTKLWIRSNGTIGIGDDFHDSTARLHIRNEADATVAFEIMGHDAQSADLTRWDKKVVTTLAAILNPGDPTMHLTSSAAFAASGTVYVNNGHPIYRYLPVAYTANNTGTGVLTLAAPYAGISVAGAAVYQPQAVASMDPAGIFTAPTVQGSTLSGGTLNILGNAVDGGSISMQSWVTIDNTGTGAPGRLTINADGNSIPGSVTMQSQGTNDFSAPPAGEGTVYVRDNGSGKMQLVVRFPTGAVQVIATEP